MRFAFRCRFAIRTFPACHADMPRVGNIACCVLYVLVSVLCVINVLCVMLCGLSCRKQTVVSEHTTLRSR